MSNVHRPPEITGNYLDGISRIRISHLQEAKRRKEKWVMLTSYDTVSAKVFDAAKVPCLLIGDSAAQTVYGYSSTLGVTIDELIPLARAVSSSCKRALVVGDLPFGSYQESPQVALRSATRLMKEAGVHAIKLEGGAQFEDHVRLLTQSGIPVMAHIGFTPQSEHALGGFKVQGRGRVEIDKLISDAVALEQAGAFSCVIELCSSEVASEVTRVLSVPTIGIGAGPDCDAQVLVWQDMAGFSAPKSDKSSGYLRENSGNPDGAYKTNATKLELERVPKFVKRFANITESLYEAARSFQEEVKSGQFPSKEHCYD